MAILFVGLDPMDFGGAPLISTSTTGRNAAYTPFSLTATAPQSGVSANPFSMSWTAAAGDTIWCHFRWHQGLNHASTLSTGYLLNFRNAANQILATYDYTTGGIPRAQALGDTTVNGNNGPLPGVNGLITVDMKLVVNNSVITFEIYHGGSLITAATAANTVGLKGKPTLCEVIMDTIGGGGGSTMFFNEIVVADVDTRGWRVSCEPPASAGHHTAWTGTVASLADNLATTGISSNAPLQKFSYIPTAYAGPANPVGVANVLLRSSAQVGSGTPSTVRHFLRVGSTDYEGNATTASYYTRQLSEWTTNPATSANWTVSDLSNIQGGLKSET